MPSSDQDSLPFRWEVPSFDPPKPPKPPKTPPARALADEGRMIMERGKQGDAFL